MTETPVPPMIRERGREEYAACFEAMRAFTDARGADTPDEIWLVEHPPVFTLGQAGDPAHLLVANSGIPMVQIDRGGQITYHGPGQVVAYLLIDLRRRKLFVRALVEAIEEAVIRTLAAYNLPVERKSGAPGIYLSHDMTPQAPAGAKIAALGLKIRNGCSYHGVSLNVDMDLSPFDWINPCGYAGLRTVDMKCGGIAADWHEVARRLAAELTAQLSGRAPARGATSVPADVGPQRPDLADTHGCATRATEIKPAQP